MIASRAAKDPRDESACGDLGQRGEVEVFVPHAGFFLEPRHHRVVQVPLGGEVAVHRSLADAGALRDGAERERVPLPRVELVDEGRTGGDDPLAVAAVC